MDQEKSLTIPPRRLAGNPSCLNCGTSLEGPFCHYCGQPDKNLLRFFPVLMRELLEDSLDFDSRFMRTIKPLLFRPGKLTRDYLDGKRFRFTPPLRLYIFSSIAFFFLAAMLAGSAVDVTMGDSGAGANITFNTEGEEKSEAQSQQEFEQAKAAIEQLDPAIREHITINEEDRSIEASASVALPFIKEIVAEASRDETDEPAAAESEPTAEPAPEGEATNEEEGNPYYTPEDYGEDDWSVQFNDEPWDRETNPLIIPFLPDWLNDHINDEIERSPEKGKAIEENPNLFLDKFFEVLPITMFILLPIAALIMKFWYLFSKTYYVEHLIYALHNHSFLFVILLLWLLVGTVSNLMDATESGLTEDIANGIQIIILIWIPLYFLVSLKRVYRQGWFMTITKYLLVSTSYFTLLTTASVVVAVTSFLLLEA